MMAFLAANFNLPTVIVAGIVFGGAGWLLYRTRKSGGSCGAAAVAATAVTGTAATATNKRIGAGQKPRAFCILVQLCLQKQPRRGMIELL